MVELLENVRGKDVFVLQSTCAPTNDNLMELLLMIDAANARRRARSRRRSLISAMADRTVARARRVWRSARSWSQTCSPSSGVARVLTVDLHADQIQGFFDIPVDNVYASPVLLGDVWKQRFNEDIVVVSPDVGGVVRARALAKRLETRTWRSSTNAARSRTTRRS